MTTYHLTELIAQPYTDARFSAGTVADAGVDTLYLEVERNGVRDVLLLLRPDEAAALVYCLAGALYSHGLLAEENREALALAVGLPVNASWDDVIARVKAGAQ